MTSKAKPKKPEPKKVAVKAEPKVTHKAVEVVTPDVITNGADEPVVTVTDAKAAVADKDGHAVMTVEVPARTVEVSIAHSAIEGCAVAAVEAWDKVKGVGDPSFADCLPDHRRDLMYHAEGVYRGNKPSEGDTSMARFEQEVTRIKREQGKAKAAKAA